MSIEVRTLPQFDDSSPIKDVLQAFEAEVPGECMLETLKMALQGTLAPSPTHHWKITRKEERIACQKCVTYCRCAEMTLKCTSQ